MGKAVKPKLKSKTVTPKRKVNLKKKLKKKENIKKPKRLSLKSAKKKTKSDSTTKKQNAIKENKRKIKSDLETQDEKNLNVKGVDLVLTSCDNKTPDTAPGHIQKPQMVL